MPRNQVDKDRGRVGHRALKRERAAVLEHDDDRLADGRDRLGQLLLRLGHDDLGARLRFARHALRFADGEDDDVRRARGGDGLFDAAGKRLFDARARSRQ